MNQKWPDLAIVSSAETLSGLHAFAKLLGAYCRVCAPRRKHWWHISLKPVVAGFTTGPLHSNGQLFELVLDFQSLSIGLRIAGGEAHEFSCQGESARSLKGKLSTVLSRHGVTIELDQAKIDAVSYELDQGFASKLGQVYGQLALSLARLRSVLPVETSPIQLWPHHFDLAMLVLTGRKIPGHDPENEEYSDEQLNFGFVPGDEGIGEPYFFITLYAQAGRLAGVQLPDEAYFHTEGWSGIVMPYDSFRKNPQADSMLLNLWQSAWKAAEKEIDND
jgi:hypothetical protein